MKYSLHNGVLSAKTVSCKLIVTYYHGNYKGNHQNEVLYITKAKALYIIIAKEDTACG